MYRIALYLVLAVIAAVASANDCNPNETSVSLRMMKSHESIQSGHQATYSIFKVSQDFQEVKSGNFDGESLVKVESHCLANDAKYMVSVSSTLPSTQVAMGMEVCGKAYVGVGDMLAFSTSQQGCHIMKSEKKNAKTSFRRSEVNSSPSLTSLSLSYSYSYTHAPSSFPSSSPSSSPSSFPTAHPSSNPTTQPSSLPSAFPTAAPTGTYTPTVKPTRAPTVVGQTPIPTTANQVQFTASPTRQPQATPYPTSSPTQATVPIMSFDATLTISGVTIPSSRSSLHALARRLVAVTLDSATQVSIVLASATSQGVSPEYVSFVGAVSSGPNTIVATTQTNIPLVGDYANVNTATLYNNLKDNLSASVGNGAFTTYLQAASNANGATATASAQGTSSTTTQPQIILPSSSNSKDGLSDGDIAAAVIFSILGAALIVGAIYYFFIAKGGSDREDFNPIIEDKANNVNYSLEIADNAKHENI